MEFTNEAVKSLASLSNKLSNRSKAKTSAQKQVWKWEPEHIMLSGPALQAFSRWKLDTLSFLKDSIVSTSQSISCARDLYYEARRQQSTAALSQLHDSIYCLFFYWIGGPSAKLKDGKLAFQSLCAVFKGPDIADETEKIRDFVREQWRFGWKLDNFCAKCLGESATVFFLPHLAAK